MKTSKVGIDLIKEFEGLKLEAYRCPANIWSIGYGHVGGYKEGDKITKEKAEELLIEDLELFETLLNKEKLKVKQNEFDALISFIYNLGFRAFKNSTLFKFVKANDKEKAANEFKRWIYAAGKPLEGLKRRRQREETLFLGK